MSFLEIFFTGLALSMDAFSVSICKGLTKKKINLNFAFLIAFIFGFTQGFMPYLGYLLDSFLKTNENIKLFIDQYNNLIAFFILFILGLKMIYDSCKDIIKKRLRISDKVDKDISNKPVSDKVNYIELILLGLATSIDALMVGFAYATQNVNIYIAVLTIGFITFIMCFAGVYIGKFFGSKWKFNVGALGGACLCLIGIKFLLEHFNVINF